MSSTSRSSGFDAEYVEGLDSVREKSAWAVLLGPSKWGSPWGGG